MAFSKKTWTDRLSEYATRRILTDQDTGTVSVVEVARSEGTIYQAGDAFSAANMNDLEDRIENGFDEVTSVFTATLTSSSWAANPDTDTQAEYPYIYEITSSLYTNDSAPIWDCIGTATSGIPTSAEMTAITLIQQAYFSTSGVTLYATDAPTDDVVFRARGV